MRVAIIGTGVSGLGAAYLLSRTHEIQLFERAERPGGHACTIMAPGSGGSPVALDIGFIVHNDRNYPNLVTLLRDLGVQTRDTQMSFAVSDAARDFEYCASRLPLQPGLFLRRATRALVIEILRFLRHARVALREPLDGQTLADFTRVHGYTAHFRDLFLVPLTAALWSTPLGRALDFPASYALRFLDNHGLLSIGRQHWRTIVGGSTTYVDRLLAPLQDRLSLGREISEIRRDVGGVDIRERSGATHRFDAVVIATHADQALGMLGDATARERDILGQFRYTGNDVVLHTDERLLPRRQAVRGAWNCQLTTATDREPSVTYYLNRLLRLDEPEHYCVTLNRSAEINPERIIHTARVRHPQYTFDSLRAQHRLAEISVGRTWFCGAYHGNGFHEAGLTSGLTAANGILALQ